MREEAQQARAATFPAQLAAEREGNARIRFCETNPICPPAIDDPCALWNVMTTPMSKLKITAGPYTFDARLETEAAPKTCAAFLKHVPFKSQVVHVRWSGEAVWIPLGDLDFGVGYENHTSFPAPGQIILYPGGISETEI